VRGIGFGLERLGLAAFARPGVFAAVLLLVTGFASYYLPSVRFDGNVISVVPKSSQAYQKYDKHRRDFRNFTRDVAMIVQSDRLSTANGMEDFRFMQLEIALIDGVASTFSVFSIPSADPQTGELGQFFPPVIETDQQANELLDRLYQELPQSSGLFSVEENAAIIIIALDLSLNAGNDAMAIAQFQQVRDAALAASAEDFQVYFAGATPIGITIIETLVQDQLRLTLIGLAIGAGIAFVLFRSLSAAFLCGIPATLTALWGIGLFGYLQVPITYMTTILPTLALVLAYADSIVLYHRWNTSNAVIDPDDRKANLANLHEAICRVGPASALTSITTAVAISSFMFSTSEALFQFGQLGIALIMFAFLAVILTLPVLGVFMVRASFLKPSGKQHTVKLPVGKFVVGIYEKHPRRIALTALFITLGMFYVHNLLQPDYRVTDFLPRNSDSLTAESYANDVFGGRSFIYFSVPVVEEGGLSSANNRARLLQVTRVLSDEFGEGEVFSIARLYERFSDTEIEELAQRIGELPPESRESYLSKDGTRMLVSLRSASNQSIVQTRSVLDRIDGTLSPLPYADGIDVTGFQVLLATEFRRMINELRTSLLIAVGVGILLVMLATRSFALGLAAAIPNLLPILGMEFFIWLRSGTISITEVVALTLAFGIAVDNAVHVLNVYRAERRMIEDRHKALENALKEVAPALGASTLILCMSTSVVLLSSLPILSVIGQLIIIILIVALLTNLIVLPANILSLRAVKHTPKK